jgi:Spy/CpxP family protein refolding chaperone
MKRLALWSLLVLSLSANAAFGASMLRQRPVQPAIPDEPQLFSRVALDASQRERILELRTLLLRERSRQSTELEALRGRLAEQLAQAPEDTQAVGFVLARIEEAQAAFQRRVVEHVLSVRSVLRPDQRPAFSEIVARQLRAGGPMHAASTSPAPPRTER